MFDNRNDIIIEEMNVKPNKYSAKAMAFVIVAAIIVWLLTEFGVFRSSLNATRISFLIASCFLVVPIIIAKNKKFVQSKASKYVIVGCSIVATLVVSVVLFFHATIIIMFPLFIAMQYKSKKMGYIALAGSTLTIIVAPILGYVFKLWDTELFKYLIEICGGTVSEPFVFTGTLTFSLACEIILYLSIPKLLVIVAFGIFMFNAINIGIESVDNQIKLNMFNQIDGLTGLYNRNYYKYLVAQELDNKNVGIIFFDVNGLKKVNDAKGHEFGDLLLRKCAESIIQITSDKVVGIRYGGDEFLVVADVDDSLELENLVKDWLHALDTINEESKNKEIICSMAYGVSFGKFSEIKELIRQADLMMYESKGKNNE